MSRNRGRLPSRITTLTLLGVLVAALVVSTFVFHRRGGPDAGQSTPYWSAWNAWQDKGRPVFTKFSNDVSAVAVDFTDLGLVHTTANANILANALVTLGVETDAVRALGKSPDATLNAKFASYINSVSAFETRFVASSKNTKKNQFGWVPSDLASILKDDQAVNAVWDKLVREYNSR